MIVGFSGTRHGMTAKQKERFSALIEDLGITEFHHGDCVGSDDDAATIVHESGLATVVLHPPTDKKLQAFNPSDASNCTCDSDHPRLCRAPCPGAVEGGEGA